MAAVAQQSRPAGRHDVARFLAAHEGCGSDFEIQRVEGPGHGALKVTCNGCGDGAAYDMSEPGVLKLSEPPAPPPKRGHNLSRNEVERWLPAPAALPWWVPNAYILGLIAVGLAMIAFGLLRGVEEDRPLLGGADSSGPPAAEQPPAESAEGPQPSQAGALPVPPAKQPEPSGREDGERAEAPELDRVIVLSRFEIGVPEGWSRGMEDGAVVFRADEAEAEIRVFLEPGDEGPRDLAREAARFLEAEHPDAKLSSPERFQLRGAAAMRLVARYKGGSERAAVLSESGYAYLLLGRVEGSDERAERAARASLRSFRAL